MAEPLAVDGTGYEVVAEEPPELLGRNLVSASYLLSGATAFFFLFVLGAMVWLEMCLATSLRYRKIETGAPPPGHASGDPYREAHDIRDPLSLVRAELVGLSFYWTFLAAIAVVTWVV